jgi:hypothetical protein
VEFLESKYADRTAAAAGANPLSRFADAVEEKMRAGKVSASTIAETMGLMNRAMGVLNGAAAAGKSVANDLMSATSRVVDAATTAASTRSGSPPSTSAPGSTSGTTAANDATATPPDGRAGGDIPPR